MRNSVLILMYHRIAQGLSCDRYTVSTELFKSQMSFLVEHGYRVTSLRDFVSALEADRQFPDSSIVITFDDGFESTFDQAVPVLKTHAMPATFFLVSDHMGKSSEWTARSRSSAHRLMDWDQALQLRQSGFELGSHTCSHPRLTDVNPIEARREIELSKIVLEDRLGCPVEAFAYPFGAHNSDVREVVSEAGYRCACSTLSGFNDSNADRYLLRRIDVFGDDSMTDFRRKLTFGANRVGTGEMLKYYFRRAQSKLLRA